MPPALETRDLTIRFGGHTAVDGVSAAFHAGTLTAVVGPNGAGKTTYFNLVSGQLRATAGTVALGGRDITRLGPADRARAGLGRAFQITNLFPNLTVHENVRLAIQGRSEGAAQLFSRASRRRDWIEAADGYLAAVSLSSERDLAVSTLPHGAKRKLEVALMMALEPAVYLFDEPTAGMSVDEVPVVLDLIARLKARGDKAILLVEHKMDVVRSLADRIIVLQNGRLVADGDPQSVIASPVVQEAYLGVAPVTQALDAAGDAHG